MVKNLPANAGDVRDLGSIPGSGRSSGGGHGNPLQYTCLENPRDRGAWRATVHRVAKSRHDCSDLAHMHAQLFHILDLEDLGFLTDLKGSKYVFRLARIQFLKIVSFLLFFRIRTIFIYYSHTFCFYLCCLDG